MSETTSETKIPCLSLQLQHQQIKAEVFEAFEKVYEKTAFSGGHFAQQFEDNFAAFCGTEYAIALNSGTSALHLALLVMGVGPGDEVIVPANTFIATAWAVTYSRAKLVFVDCTNDTWQIDPRALEEKINSNTKAVIGVHLYGQPFDVDAVKEICDRHGIMLLEDAAQAHGASYNDVTVGGFGEMACFSFYTAKNLGACGEGGGVTTNNEDYYKHLQSLRNHGMTRRYYHDEVGFNMRMGGLESASLTVKLKYIGDWNDRRREVARRYQAAIVNPKITMQSQPSWANSVYHLFVVTAEDRDDLITYLNGHNIFPALHYPVPCHLQKAYEELNYVEGDFPNSEYLAAHCVSLPMFAELTDEEVSSVITHLNNY